MSTANFKSEKLGHLLESEFLGSSLYTGPNTTKKFAQLKIRLHREARTLTDEGPLLWT